MSNAGRTDRMSNKDYLKTVLLDNLPCYTLEELASWMTNKKTGKFELNFHQGAVGSIEVKERKTQ